MSLANLKTIYDYFNVAVRKAIRLSDFYQVATAIPEMQRIARAPALLWLSTTTVQVQGTADIPVGILMLGFPSILNPGQFVTGGLTDGWYREVATATSLDISSASYRWGSEKPSQWYAVFAKALAADTAFTLKAMPIMRFMSQASQVITLRNNANSANIGYGFATDELIGFKIYVLSGASAGLLRTITHNNNDDATGGTITYSGTALTMSQGDWFVVLPATNFRWLGNVRNNSSSNLIKFYQDGNNFRWGDLCSVSKSTGGVVENVDAVDPMATWYTLNYEYSNYAAQIITQEYTAHPDETARRYSWPLLTIFTDPYYSYYGNLLAPVKNCRTYFCVNANAGVICADYILPPGFFG